MNEQQKEYGEFAAQALNATAKTPKNIFFAEADAGINRTLGYLTPVLQRITENPSERILLCISNRAKQKQIFETDIPNALKQLLESNSANFAPDSAMQANKVRAALLKERFNYVCLRKFNDCIEDVKHYLTVEERVIFLSLLTWAGKTKDGDLNEVLHYNRSPILWKKVACEPVSCLGEKCKRYDECYFQKAKKEAANSNLLLVSHQLFLQDLNIDFAILPLYAKAIFDDSHRLYAASSKAFGRNLYFYALRNIIRQNAWCDKWAAAAAESEKNFLALVRSVQEFCAKAKKRKFAYAQNFAAETGISPEPLQNALTALLECVEQTTAEFSANITNAKSTSTEENENAAAKAKDCAQFASDIRKIKSDLTFLFAASHGELVYWVESNSNPYQVSFCAEPINAGYKWYKSFYPAVQSAFFTSDVLCVGKQFDYFSNCIGLGGNRRTIGKIFAGKSAEDQPSVMSIDFLPKPTEQNFNAELVKALSEFLPRNPENTIVFCDFWTIQKLSPVIASAAASAPPAITDADEAASEERISALEVDENAQPQPPRRIFSQGLDGNFYNLLGFFAKEQGGILLGSADEIKTLEDAELPKNLFVAVTRLPFPDIKDPVFEARQNLMKSQGKNAFMLLTLPETILTLRKLYAAISRSPKNEQNKEAFGEAKQGKRALFFMDSRIFSEQYGLKIQKIWEKFTLVSHRLFCNGNEW